MISMKINHFSDELQISNDCRVLLPDDVKDGEKLKVLWLCHGGSGDENEWMYYSTIPSIPDEKHIAIVINNANESCFVDMAHSRNYGKYIGEELPNIIFNMFSCLSDKREDNFISGLSNGGYGCFLVGLKNRERFAAIGAFSAGDKADAVAKPGEPNKMSPRIRMFGQDDISETDYSMKYLAKKIAQMPGNKPRIYHACGGLDPWLDMNLKVRQCMEEINLPEYDYVYHQIDDLGHEWKFWDIEIRNFLEYLGI